MHLTCNLSDHIKQPGCWNGISELPWITVLVFFSLSLDLYLISLSAAYLFIFVMWKVISRKYTLNQGQGKAVLWCDTVATRNREYQILIAVKYVFRHFNHQKATEWGLFFFLQQRCFVHSSGDHWMGFKVPSNPKPFPVIFPSCSDCVEEIGTPFTCWACDRGLEKGSSCQVYW